MTLGTNGCNKFLIQPTDARRWPTAPAAANNRKASYRGPITVSGLDTRCVTCAKKNRTPSRNPNASTSPNPGIVCAAARNSRVRGRESAFAAAANPRRIGGRAASADRRLIAHGRPGAAAPPGQHYRRTRTAADPHCRRPALPPASSADRLSFRYRLPACAHARAACMPISRSGSASGNLPPLSMPCRTARRHSPAAAWLSTVTTRRP